MLYAMIVIGVTSIPSVYWRRSPNREGDAVMLAGSFGTEPSVHLCADAACVNSTQLPLLDAYEYSV